MAFNFSPKVVTDGLVLNLDAANSKSYVSGSSNFYNLITTNNNATLQNTPIYDTNNLGNFSLDGTNQRLYIPFATNTIRCYDCTIQFTIKLPVYSGGQRVILSFRGASGGLLYLGKQNSGIFSYYDTLTPTPAYTAGNIPNNTIAICAVVIDSTGGNISIYTNGVLAGTATGRAGFSSAYNTQLYLGYDAGGTNEYMLGNFYNFSFYNRVLTSQEILQNYNATKSRFGLI
jgi:hypothetical protein